MSLHCIYNADGEMLVVSDHERNELLQSGKWFKHPDEANQTAKKGKNLPHQPANPKDEPLDAPKDAPVENQHDLHRKSVEQENALLEAELKKSLKDDDQKKSDDQNESQLDDKGDDNGQDEKQKLSDQRASRKNGSRSKSK
jgi:hypothetical protein